VLIAAAEKAGLDGAAARAVLESGRYAQEVRDAERLWQSRGITGVPAVIVNNRYLISGGQPARGVRAGATRDRRRTCLIHAKKTPSAKAKGV
jgi:predicted DsbA family dithiol-disulfide isomerase